MAMVTADEAGNIYGIGTNDNWNNCIYRLENDEFIKMEPEFQTETTIRERMPNGLEVRESREADKPVRWCWELRVESLPVFVSLTL